MSMTADEIKRRKHRNQRIAAAVLVLIVAAGVGVLIRINRADEEEFVRQTTYIPKVTKITPEVELLQHYIRFDTSNPPGNEGPAAQWLAGILRANGVQAEVIESAPRRASVYARIKGKQQGTGLLLLHHIDVVPASPEGWKRPPFSGDVYLNQLYGRGSVDMKGMAITHLRAFLDVARSGRVPEHDLVFLGVADEETGSALGMKWLFDHRPDVIAGIRYAINEGGITEMKEEHITYFGIETGTKQIVSMILKAKTRDQLQQARIHLEPWFVSREPQRVLPEVKRFFRYLAPHRVDFREELSDIDRAISRGKFWALPLGYRELTQNGVWAEGVTPVSDAFEMRTQLLNLPDEDPDRRIVWLAKEVAPFGVTVDRILRKEGPVPISSDQTPFFKLIAQEAERTFQTSAGTEILNRWFNDSRFLRQRGIEAYGVNTFPIDFFQAESIHAVDERIRVDYFVEGVEFTRRLVGAYAFNQ
jgi:acetylornithine deacetylase/succinyl-diaminopimelate desuccinylase-like protein